MSETMPNDLSELNVGQLIDAARQAERRNEQQVAEWIYQSVIKRFPGTMEAAVARGDLERIAEQDPSVDGPSQFEAAGPRTSDPATADVKDYGTGHVVAVFTSFVGWGAVIFGVVALLLSVATVRVGIGLLGIMPAFGMIVAGLLLVVAGQTSRAVFDAARNSHATLALTRQQLRLQTKIANKG